MPPPPPRAARPAPRTPPARDSHRDRSPPRTPESIESSSSEEAKQATTTKAIFKARQQATTTWRSTAILKARPRGIAPTNNRTQSQPVPDKRKRTISGTARSSVDAAVDNRSRSRSPSRRFGRGKSVKLLTCGFNKLHVKDPSNLNYGGEMSAWMGELEHAIQVKTQLNVKLDFTCKLLDMRDPGGDKSLRGHWGENANIMRAMIQNKVTLPKFKRHLARLKDNIEEFVHKYPRQKCLNIALVCRSGRHRSVCVAAYLKYCLLFEKFDCETIHINQDGWNHLCTTCRQCGACPETKDGLYEDVLKMWRAC